MNNIKLYKELCYIETFDWEVIALDEDLETLKSMINTDHRFLDLGSEIIAKSSIKKISKRSLDEIDNYILTQITDKNLRARIESEVSKRRKQGDRLNMAILNNIIKRISE